MSVMLKRCGGGGGGVVMFAEVMWKSFKWRCFVVLLLKRCGGGGTGVGMLMK